MPYALISGGTVLVTFLALPPQSLPGKYLDGDVNLLVPYGGRALLAASLALLLALLTWGRRGGRRPPWRHLAVPLVLTLFLPPLLAVCGGARSRWGTGLLCAALAAGIHLTLALPRRPLRVLICGSLVAVVALTAVGCQTRWRAEDFRATRLPFYVADIPGYRLSATYADVGVIFLTYEGEGSLRVEATISRQGCPASAPCFDLPRGNRLAVAPPHTTSDWSTAGPLPGGIAVRPVSARYLAAFPVSGTSLPD